MKVLYAAMRHDYGRPEAGESFEEVAFHDTLRQMGHEVLPFDAHQLARDIGRRRMNARLVNVARAERPDVLFCVPFTDEVAGATVRAIRGMGARAVCWFCDDHWRFERFSRTYARYFDLVVTTDPDALARYRAAGIEHVTLQQWACNPQVHRRISGPPLHDVTFVGMAHGRRREMLEVLRRAGLDVRAWGGGWNTGRLTRHEMVEVFARSRINLNFAESSTDGSRRQRLRTWVDHKLRFPLLGAPGLWRLGRMIPAAPPLAGPPQIKARVFEVLGCGGFLLTEDVPHLNDYVAVGREVATFADADELVERCRHFLSRDAERTAIAAAGCERVRREHTYPLRFAAIFTQLALPASGRRLAA